MIQFSICNIFHMFLQNVLSIEENSPMRIKRGCPIHCHPWPAWPARPHLHRHCNPPIWNLELMPRQTSGLTSRLSVLKVEIIETSGCHRTVQRPFLAPPNGSERFRTVQKHFLGVRVQLWHDSAGGLWCGSSSTGSVGNLSWRDEVSTFWFLTHLKILFDFTKKVRLLPGNFVKLTFCILNFNLWHSIYCTLVFQSSGFVTE